MPDFYRPPQCSTAFPLLQYRENATIINPAAMESDFLAYGQPITVGGNYRSQWSDISGNPRTQSLRFSFVGDNSGASLLAGGYILNDQTAPTGFTGIYGRLGAVISGDPEYSGLVVALSGGLYNIGWMPMPLTCATPTMY
ncbi:MAG: type IX secretion system membrane protein PorP/SprF [Saprospiraceae bacterium]